MIYKTAIITGASSGIGRAAALDLAKQGVNLLLCARRIEKLNELKNMCEEYSIECYTYVLDMHDLDCIAEMVNYAGDILGSIDVLINCAGIYPQDGLGNVTAKIWDEVMELNLRNTFFLTQSVFEKMKSQEAGYIIFINSTVALGAKPDVSVYSISKYGLEGAAAAFYEAGKNIGIRVSSVYPGVTNTDTLRGAGMPCLPEQCMLPEDIAQCISFLLNTPPRMVVKDLVPWASAYDKI